MNHLHDFVHPQGTGQLPANPSWVIPPKRDPARLSAGKYLETPWFGFPYKRGRRAPTQKTHRRPTNRKASGPIIFQPSKWLASFWFPFKANQKVGFPRKKKTHPAKTTPLTYPFIGHSQATASQSTLPLRQPETSFSAA